MAPPSRQQAHSRSHSLLLVQKLLNLRDGASPLTLVLDSLEQSARPVVAEFVTRARIARSKIILVSFSTVRKPADVDVFVKARGKPLAALRDEIVVHCSPPALGDRADRHNRPAQKCLIIIDTLNPLAARHPHALPAFLAGIVVPLASLVAVYHTDVPLVFSDHLSSSPSASSLSSSSSSSPPPRTSTQPPPYHHGDGYGPDPLTLLCHLATAVLRTSGLHQAAGRRRAHDRSLPEPEWGLREGREGVLVGLRTAWGHLPDHHPSEQQRERVHECSGGAETKTKTKLAPDEGGGVVVEMEMRRRSGRGVVETFVLATPSRPASPSAITLLTDHPMFATRANDHDGDDAATTTAAAAATTATTTTTAGEDGAGGSSSVSLGGRAGTTDEGQSSMETTFSLGLTDKQRRDREGVVLPYFDAQTDIGGGEGGRILYEMGREDDFDEEEEDV